MKQLFLSMTLFLFCFSGVTMANENLFHPSKGEELVNITLGKIARVIKKKI